MKIDRLLSITLMLINRPMVTAQELSGKYEVSVRTIYRDIDAISAAGIPVVSYQGKRGGFSLMENYRVDRQLLTLSDMISILTALKGINTSFGDKGIGETIEKIESLVPNDKRETVARYFERVRIDLAPWWEPRSHRQKLRMLHEALAANRMVSFLYRNLRGEERARTVEPMSLTLKVNTWYLYAYCHGRGDFRLFRLSRIRACRLLDRSFAPRPLPADYRELFSSDKRQPVTMRLRFSPSAQSKVEEYFGDSIVSNDREGIVVEAAFPEDEWVYSLILGFGDQVEVLSPAHLRRLIAQKTNAAAARYKT